ncbi:hypothetical protein MATL_G00170960, partial [Megalops atlanticus]
MNVGIFLRQFKSAASEIVEDIRQGAGERYGAEKLSELSKLLPDSEEEKKLRSYQGERSRLGEPDLFMVMLVEVPSFRLRLDAMILQQEFDPAVTSLCVAARCLGDAARELLNCLELHSILHLVLRAGNYMNAGGYAGNAAGFRIASLLKLADTKANKPGMNLLHFVAMEAIKKDPGLLSFPSQLGHVGPASRLSEEGVQEDLSRLHSRVAALRDSVQTEAEIQQQTKHFLEAAEVKLEEAEAEVEALRMSSQALVEFFCEDDNSFKLEEACCIFYSFCHRFQKAVKENAERELQELRRAERERESAEKRRSIATCSVLELGQGQDDLERTLERNLSYTWHRRSLRHPEARRPSLRFAALESNTDTSHSLRDLSSDAMPVKQELNADNAQSKLGLNNDNVRCRQRLNADTPLSGQVLSSDTKHSQHGLKTDTLSSLQSLPVDSTPSQCTQPSDSTHRLRGLTTDTTHSSQELPTNTIYEQQNQTTDTMHPRPELSFDSALRSWGAVPQLSESISVMVTDRADAAAREPSPESAQLLRLVSERVLSQQTRLGTSSALEMDKQLRLVAPEPVPLLAQEAELPSPGSERMYPRVGETLECHTLVRGLRSYENLSTPVPRAAPSHCSKWKKEREAEEREGAKSPQSKDDARIGKEPVRGLRRGSVPRPAAPANTGIPRVRAKAEPACAEDAAS